MSALRYVCLSDLHLGAADSLLTHTDGRGQADPGTPSDTLRALGRALRQYVASLSDGTPPRLILLGDVLDMGLSPLADAARGYQRFVEALFPAGEPAVFAPQVLCLPGNHDHHLWHMACDRHLLNTLDAQEVLEIQNTALFLDDQAPPLVSDLLTRLMTRYPHLAGARVDIAYPNLGFYSAATQRCVVLHHGHYIDSIYRLVSTLNTAVMGPDAAPRTVAQIEQQNGPWVDFLWSGLGGAGASGKMANTLYEVLCDASASRRFSQRLAQLALDKLAAAAGVGSATPTVRGVTVGQWMHGLMDATLGRSAQSERHGNLHRMPEVAGLRWYLSGPLLAQIRQAALPADVRETAFVFGHTHKPFQDELVVHGFDLPVALYNTGGWVMDQPTMSVTQGASAVFIDADLNLASLRLFNDPLNGQTEPVRAAGVGGMRDLHNPLLDAMACALEPTEAAWAQFSACATEAAHLRAHRLFDKFLTADRPTASQEALAS